MPVSIPTSTLEKFSTFGDLLRFLRRRVGITQIELAEAVGYSDAQISRLEQNLRPPDLAVVQARFVPALGLEDEPRTIARLLDLAANIRREDAPAFGLCPYKGLNYFEEADADLFVGREALSEKLQVRVLDLAKDPSRFLAIVGASGSGKSSLVRAGLVPALRWNSQSMDWLIHVLTPTSHPLESLAANLTQSTTFDKDHRMFADDLVRDPGHLHHFILKRLEAGNQTRALLVIDQFEEVFTLCRSLDERASFIDNLLTAASEPHGPVLVVVMLRADFYAHCSAYLQLREALAKNQEYIGSMSDQELRRAIEEPARRGRWDLEPGLVDLLLHDVGHEPGALPLLSHALLETWQRRRGRTMTLGGYTSSGGVRGAIAETAEAVFADQFTHAEQAIARRIFLRLTELGDESGASHTRRRATFTELILNPEEAASTQAVLKTLADARLITTSEDAAEVAHEALIREWPTLHNWLEENQAWLRLHRQLTEAAQEWANMNREPDLLYRGARLAQTQEWAEIYEDEINTLERQFMAASIEARENEARQREAQRQHDLEAAQKLAQVEQQRAEEQTRSAGQLRKRALYLTGAFIIALMMALVALFFGSQARQTAVKAQTDQRTAQSRELAAASLNNLGTDPERSILLALQAVSTTLDVDGAVLPEAEEALHHSIVTSPIRLTLTGHATRVLSAAFSPDGKRLATIGDEGTVIVWDPTTGQELIRLPGGTQPSDLVTAQRLVYSPDGKMLVVCDDQLIIVYDPVSGELIRSLTGHQTDVTAVQFSRDGKRIASGSVDGNVFIWNAVGGDLYLGLSGHTDAIEGLTFSPDNKWLVTSSDDATMKIWDVANGRLLGNYSEFTGAVDSVVFSPDGTKLAFTTVDGLHNWQVDINNAGAAPTITSQETLSIPEGASVIFSPNGTQLAATNGSNVKLWDARSGRELLTLAGHTDWVMGLAFSPDGEQLASTSLDGKVKIWSITPGEETITISGSVGTFGTRIVFSPDGQEFATTGGDGSANLWDAITGEPRLTLTGHSQEVLGVPFSLDGRHFATASFDATAIIWDLATGQRLLTLIGHQVGVRDIAFSPDGKLIATGGLDGTAKIWDASTGVELLTNTGHAGLVTGVAFSPDGTRLATSSTDETAQILDTKTGQLLFVLSGHTKPIPDITFSPDGTKLVTGSQDTTAKIWDSLTGAELITLTGHSSEIQAVAFSPDGRLIATGSGDNTAKIWETETGRELYTLPGNQGGVTGVAFSPMNSGAHLMVASKDSIVREFMLQIEDLLALAKSRVTRSLTEAECRKYLHLDRCD